MWSLLPRKLQATAIVFATIIAYLGLEWTYAWFASTPPGPFRQASFIVTIITGVLVLAANWAWPLLWRMIPALGRTLFPDLNGVWQGKLVSTWVDPATGEVMPPIDATITIRQTLFTTHVSLKTGESTSHSTRAFLERFAETQRFRIWYSYNNDAQAQFQHRSSPHEGVGFLECESDDLGSLTGRYYTARKTTGDIEVSRRSSSTQSKR
ncbi:Cap15 family cyclic dinucleotide receptor domain-containing protein [Microvirga aerophila]|uniref:CD-NTase-associated protein 15 domain-containing protein n=1 Tax=Microvirga aerophila TaxID=670291 RepID=A0A512C0Z3_9HYPH|nr:hypothetical protein [Microvirga aerophila]GEO17873.1 hypothetical protein MAE02_55690 [Microvirga aerophila]